MEIDIKGHSGCCVDVVRDGKQLFIYKTTRDKSYLSRLRMQGEKQAKAQACLSGHIKVPRILDIVCDSDATLLKMEYVYSKNYVEYFEHAGFEQIDLFIREIIQFVENEIAQCVLTLVPSTLLMNKFTDVEMRVKSKFPNDECINDILNKSKAYFLSVGENMMMPVGVCHGDLTFSNILFNGNDYYLIDFLDSFVETPLMDIVKIRQDSAFMWSRLMYSQSLDDIRLKIISERIDREIDAHFNSRYGWYSELYTTYQLMNMLRVLQYAKEDKIVEFLKRVIGGMLK